MKLERKMIFLDTAFLAALGLGFAIKASPLHGNVPATVRDLASIRLLGVMLGGAGLALWYLRRLARPADSQRLAVGWLLVHLYSLVITGAIVEDLIDAQTHAGKPASLGLWAAVLVHLPLLSCSCAVLFWRRGAEAQRTVRVLLLAEATLATLAGLGGVAAARLVASFWSSGVVIQLLGIALAGVALGLMLLGNPADGGDRRRLLLGLGTGNALTAVAALIGLIVWNLGSPWVWAMVLTSAALAAGSAWAGLRPEVARRPPTGKAWASRLSWGYLLAGLGAASLVLVAPALSLPAWAALILAVLVATGIGSAFAGDLQRILLDPIGLATLGRFTGSEEDETGRLIWLRQLNEAAAQEERNRLARDLHDSIKQQLFSINVGTATAQERWERDPEGAKKALADVRRSAREALVEMQAMLHQLRPEALGTAGLIEALREQCEALGYRTGAAVTLEVGEPVPDALLPPGAQEALFRIAQEMLANVARHARAKEVRLWLMRQGGEALIRIEDDGQGFDPAAAVSGMGLRNLSERAASLHGTLEVVSAPGAGAALTVRIPLEAPAPQPIDDAKRASRLEFLGMSFQAGFFVLMSASHLIPVPGEGIPGWLQLAGLLGLSALVLYCERLRRTCTRAARAFANRQFELLFCLTIGWWWEIGFIRDMKLSMEAPGVWSIPVAAFLYAAFALVWIHRKSEARRFWQRATWGWIVLILPVEAAILLTLGKILSKPAPLSLNLLDVTEAFFLMALAAAFPYVASRQRRTEGVAQ
jgi:signal transduction histidine kinase